MKERLEATVSGRVQMVMYRDFCCRKGHGLHLVGSAQNLRNGTVRVIAEGERVNLDAFVKKLEQGSFLARVDRVETAFLPAKGEFTRFSIYYGS